MSFEKPNMPGGASIYYPVAQSTAGSAAESLGMWLIEQLQAKYSYHRDHGGLVPIYYQWFFSLDPETAAKLPSVAIAVMTAEYPRLGSYLHAGDGAIIPGELRDAEILVCVLANNTKLRDGIEDRLSRWVSKIINGAENVPFRFLTKYDHGDDRGFSSIDRFVISSLWQNLTDEAFVKMTFFKTGYVEDYIEPEDGLGSYWQGVVGSTVYLSGDVTARATGLGHRSLAFSFTAITGGGQESKFSATRVKTDYNDITIGSDTKIVLGIYSTDIVSDVGIVLRDDIQLVSSTTIA